MRISLGKSIGRIVALVLVTLLAIAVMLTSTTRWAPKFFGKKTTKKIVDQNSALSKSPVVVQHLTKESIEITATYSGMVRSFEQYTYSFDIAGRIDGLGKNESGEELDVGDRIEKGMLLATLDRRILAAQLDEVNARKEQTQTEYSRIKRLQARNSGAVTETELQQRETDMLVAQAQARTAQKNLDDATLTASASGVISKRFFKPGESVNPRQAIFDVIQVDRVLLVVGVPQSRVAEIVKRRQFLHREKELGRVASYGEDDLKFRVYVEPAQRNSFTATDKPLIGEVYRIAPRSDDTSGLFDVEILLSNEEKQLRPGMIAVARIVTNRVDAFRTNSTTALFRENRASMFSVVPDESDVEMLFWNLGPAGDYKVRRWELRKDNYVEQGRDLIIFDIPPRFQNVVVRGHHRLVDGHAVTVVPTHDERNSENALSDSNMRTAEKP